MEFINFTVPNGTTEKLDALASAHNFSRSEELRVAVSSHLETHKKTFEKVQKMRKEIKQP